jgi:hypothetical protein
MPSLSVSAWPGVCTLHTFSIRELSWPRTDVRSTAVALSNFLFSRDCLICAMVHCPAIYTLAHTRHLVLIHVGCPAIYTLAHTRHLILIHVGSQACNNLSISHRQHVSDQSMVPLLNSLADTPGNVERICTGDTYPKRTMWDY